MNVAARCAAAMIEGHDTATFDILPGERFAGIDVPDGILVANPGIAFFVHEYFQTPCAGFQNTASEYFFVLSHDMVSSRLTVWLVDN